MKAKLTKTSTFQHVRSILIAVIASIFFRSLLWEPFHIPSESMKVNLLIGDKMFINKYSYGYSKFSFPFHLPFFSGRILSKAPQRGDIIVFVPPKDKKVYYVKRLIGLPGDKISISDGVVSVNGKVFNQTVIKEKYNRTLYEEQNELGYKYTIVRYKNPDHKSNNIEEIIVPENQYFFMGDNRDRSLDSRFDEVSTIPFENLVGKANIIFFSSKKPVLLSLFNPVRCIRWNRFFTNLYPVNVKDIKQKEEIKEIKTQ